LEGAGKRILVDCGLYQGRKELRQQNWEHPPFDCRQIDAVVLTHAHIDHSGYLPLLVRHGFTGPIYATPPTVDLCEILLRDAGRIQEEDARRANKYGYTKHQPALPLYTEEEAVQTLRQFKAFDFGRDLKLADELTLSASHAGHILGAAILSFRSPAGTVVFSGDLGRPRSPVMRAPAEIQTADLLVMESTYGDRLHPPEDVALELARIINQTAKRGGMVLIPAFAVGRSQTVMYHIHQLKQAGAIPDLPVFLDSPMAQDATDLLKRHHSEHRLSESLCHSVCQSAEYIRTPEESKALNGLKMPSIIISASGMIEGGRVLHHVKHLAPRSQNSIVFAGFQAPMTRGDRILRREHEVKIHGAMIPIRCHVEYLESLSSHADYEELLEWLGHFRSRPRVFLTHGNEASAEQLKGKIEERLDWSVRIPAFGDSFEF
jgi:metallo-beta-lactamase family protein